MNLDLDMLREMISSTLVELSNPAAGDSKPERELAAAAQRVADEADKEAEAEKKAAEKAAEEEAEADAAKREEGGSPEPPKPSTLPESFEITKGRLRQIIAEELISAKKQGIL